MSESEDAAKLKLDQVIQKSRNPEKSLGNKLDKPTNNADALQNRVRDLEAEVQRLKGIVDSDKSAAEISQAKTRKLTVDLAASQNEVVILKRKIDVLQKASAAKDATIADLNQQLSWVQRDINKKPEPTPETKTKIRRSKSSRLPGLRPGAGPASGS